MDNSGAYIHTKDPAQRPVRQELPGIRQVPDRLDGRVLLPHHQAGRVHRPVPAHPRKAPQGRQGAADDPVLHQRQSAATSATSSTAPSATRRRVSRSRLRSPHCRTRAPASWPRRATSSSASRPRPESIPVRPDDHGRTTPSATGLREAVVRHAVARGRHSSQAWCTGSIAVSPRTAPEADMQPPAAAAAIKTTHASRLSIFHLLDPFQRTVFQTAASTQPVARRRLPCPAVRCKCKRQRAHTRILVRQGPDLRDLRAENERSALVPTGRKSYKVRARDGGRSFLVTR